MRKNQIEIFLFLFLTAVEGLALLYYAAEFPLGQITFVYQKY